MSITTQGLEAEKKARKILIQSGYTNIQQLDWLVKHNGKYFAVEVKHRELFKPPPFTGTGMDIKQIERRRQIFEDLKIDTLYFAIVGDELYYNWLFTVLEKTEYFDTKNGIRVYNIIHFKKSTQKV